MSPPHRAVLGLHVSPDQHSSLATPMQNAIQAASVLDTEHTERKSNQRPQLIEIVRFQLTHLCVFYYYFYYFLLASIILVILLLPKWITT